MAEKSFRPKISFQGKNSGFIMAKQARVYISISSNVGDKSKHVTLALKRLAEEEGIQLESVSDMNNAVSLSQAVNGEYLSAVAQITTTLIPKDLLKILKKIENSFSREQGRKSVLRKIDLNLLLFGTEVINLPDLIVPNPKMHLRSSVLKGLCQLDPDLIHPAIKEPVNKLVARLNGCDFELDPGKPQLISIAGVVGIGKTTLARKLSNLFNCNLLIEPYDTNPFMPDVYAGRKELALDSQLYFLAGRKDQLHESTLASGELVIADYIFNKELVFARRLLDNQQLALYERIHASVAANIVKPVLVIYLYDSPVKCLERIHKRNRPYEQQVEINFLETLNSDYEQLFSEWKICPIISLLASNLDSSNNTVFRKLASQLEYYITKKNN